MNVSVFVFLYKGKEYIDLIEREIREQTIFDQILLSYVLTDTNDGTKEYLRSLGANIIFVSPDQFSHSLTREKVLKECSTEIAVLLTQDCRLVNKNCIEILANCIQGDIKFAYLRQVNSNRTLEKYTRMLNYPNKSLIKDKSLIDEMGINTFFASDACSAYDVKYFNEVGGYDGRNLSTNEDMYYAWKVINLGKKVKYCADSFVDHTHNFTLKQIYKRYFLVGQFFQQVPELTCYHANKSGLQLAKETLKLIIKDLNFAAFFMFVPNMLARYFGKRRGQKNK